MKAGWPRNLPVAQVRLARPTDRLQEVEQFYCPGPGLQKLGSFEKHSGYDGVLPQKITCWCYIYPVKSVSRKLCSG